MGDSFVRPDLRRSCGHGSGHQYRTPHCQRRRRKRNRHQPAQAWRHNRRTRPHADFAVKRPFDLSGPVCNRHQHDVDGLFQETTAVLAVCAGARLVHRRRNHNHAFLDTGRRLARSGNRDAVCHPVQRSTANQLPRRPMVVADDTRLGFRAVPDALPGRHR